MVLYILEKYVNCQNLKNEHTTHFADEDFVGPLFKLHPAAVSHRALISTRL